MTIDVKFCLYPQSLTVQIIQCQPHQLSERSVVAAYIILEKLPGIKSEKNQLPHVLQKLFETSAAALGDQKVNSHCAIQN